MLTGWLPTQIHSLGIYEVRTHEPILHRWNLIRTSWKNYTIRTGKKFIDISGRKFIGISDI